MAPQEPPGSRPTGSDRETKASPLPDTGDFDAVFAETKGDSEPPGELAPEQYAQVRSLFRRAVRLGPAARVEFFSELREHDPALLEELRALLAIVESAQQEAKGAPSSEADADVVLGDFRIEGRIGAGGMGIVYRARQLSLNRTVALKILATGRSRKIDSERFRREAEAAGKLDHDNIARIYYVGEDDGTLYMAMEYVEGVSLRAVVDSLRGADTPEITVETLIRELASDTRPAPTLRFDVAHSPDRTHETSAMREVRSCPVVSGSIAGSDQHLISSSKIVRDVALALDYAHSRGIIHRDIKPDNLMVNSESVVHVVDFGLARFSNDRTLTAAGQLVGTPMYMSPEQATGKLEVDHRTDIYSLGVVLYELATLRCPHAGSTLEEVLYAIVTRELVPASRENPKVDQRLEAVIHKATAKDREERYQSAGDFARDLDNYLTGKPVSAEPYRYEMDRTEIAATRPPHVLAGAFLGWFLGLSCGALFFAFLWESVTTLVAFIGCTLLSVGMGYAMLLGHGWTRGLAAGYAVFASLVAIESMRSGDSFLVPALSYVVLALAVLLATTALSLFSRRFSQWFTLAGTIRGRSKRPALAASGRATSPRRTGSKLSREEKP